MQRRLFIAVNLPEKIKKGLLDYQFKWPEIPARWVNKDNLHITLVFLGYLADDEIAEICRISKEVARKQDPFLLTFKKIVFGPPKKPPRMIWATGEKSEELAHLQNVLEKSLANAENVAFTSEKSSFSPHITLARLKSFEFRNMEPEEVPQVDEEINLNFEVTSIELMESTLKRGGSEYSVIESFPLGDY